jgi:protein-tyrosine-phosphatase
MVSQKVAFVCLHGSAKSLIAAEYFNRIAIEKNLPLRATTSGSEPDNEVPENVVAGLKRRGIDVGQVPPRSDRGRTTLRHQLDRVIRLRRGTAARDFQAGRALG